MKEIKLIHLVIVVILVLLAIAILQWTKLPRSAPAASEPSAVTAPPTELLPPPPSDIVKLNTLPPLTEEAPSFKESPGESLEPKDPSRSSQKAML